MESLSESAVIDSGEVATVFDLGGGRVVKVYRSDAFAQGDRRVAMLHREELLAYEMAATDAVLSHHVPKCHGQLPVARIVDGQGADVSGHYLLDLTISLDRVPGTPVKYGLAVGTRPHLRVLCETFLSRGLYAPDASVFDADHAADCTFIDITTIRGGELFGAMRPPGAASQADIAEWLYGGGE